MGTLFTELGAHAARIAARPRMYVDANMPAGAVAYMRETLQWDVLFVIEDADLRRARDRQHFLMARQLGRTLITLDHDYLDEQRFPPREGAGVLVVSAPDEWRLRAVLKRFDEFIHSDQVPEGPLPLDGRTLHLQTDWPGAVEPRAVANR